MLRAFPPETCHLAQRSAGHRIIPDGISPGGGNHKRGSPRPEAFESARCRRRSQFQVPKSQRRRREKRRTAVQFARVRPHDASSSACRAKAAATPCDRRIAAIPRGEMPCAAASRFIASIQAGKAEGSLQDEAFAAFASIASVAAKISRDVVFNMSRKLFDRI